jgi:hypothetical protein
MEIQKEIDAKKENQKENENEEGSTQYSFSLDNSLEETYITHSNLGKEEKKTDKEKQNLQKEAEEMKALFLQS